MTTLNAYAIKNPGYYQVDDGEQNHETIPCGHKYPIYRKEIKQRDNTLYLTKLTIKELFSHLNMWTIDQEIKSKYLDKFKHFLVKKSKEIALEDLEQQMQKPDFIKFYKHLKKVTQKPITDHLDTSVDSLIGYSAADRRKINTKKGKVKKAKIDFHIKSPRSYKQSLNSRTQLIKEQKTNHEITCEDFIIIQHFFSNIVDEQTKSVSKSDLVLYLLDNTKFCKAYDINKLTIEFKLKNYQTADHNSITLDEFINFVLYPKHIIIHVQKEQEDSLSQQTNQFDGVCQLNQQMQEFLSKIYQGLDIYGQVQVNPKYFCKALQASHDAQDYIHQIIYVVKDIMKEISLGQFLYEFETYHSLKNTQYVKLSEIINSIQNYRPFIIPSKDVILSSKQIIGIESQSNKHKFDYLNLSSQFYHILEQTFKRCIKKLG